QKPSPRPPIPPHCTKKDAAIWRRLSHLRFVRQSPGGDFFDPDLTDTVEYGVWTTFVTVP
ncbi:hypothetical protein V6O07_04805, partial [Arthrospira platensis SPKY2]